LETSAESTSFSMAASVTTASILENSTQEGSLAFNSFLTENSGGASGGGGCLLRPKSVNGEKL
jgi:hypothetical protein